MRSPPFRAFDRSPAENEVRGVVLDLQALAGRATKARNRRGLTIYEVFLALTLLLGSLAVLSQHIAVGSRAGTRARLQTHAALYAETAMSEVIGGVYPMAASNAAVTGAPRGWTRALQVTAGPTDDLLNLAVTVTHENSAGKPDASYTLHRLTRNPQALIDAAETAATNAETSAQSSSSSSSGSTSSGGSSTTGSGNR